MKTKKKELKEENIQLLRTGMSDSTSLLNANELDEIFGGYGECQNHYVTCSFGYSTCTNRYYVR